MALARPSEEATFRAGPMVNLPALIKSLGKDPATIFEACDFEETLLDSPNNRIPFVKFSDVLERCVRETGRDDLGLLLGQMSSPSHLGLPGFLMLSASTVELALQALIDSFDLHDRGGALSLDIGARHTTLRYSLLLPGTGAVSQIYDLSAVTMNQTMERLCGNEYRADSVSLERRKPRELSSYQKCFGTRLFFDATETSITFPNRWLSAVPPGSDPLLFDYLSAEARELHQRYHEDLMRALPAAMRRALLSRQYGAEDVASALGLHERTLHRRLQAAGTNFRVELDKGRRAMSEELLSSTDLPVCDIASTLGYADSSGFIRAFQRWCNSSPTAWRRALNQQQDAS